MSTKMLMPSRSMQSPLIFESRDCGLGLGRGQVSGEQPVRFNARDVDNAALQTSKREPRSHVTGSPKLANFLELGGASGLRAEGQHHAGEQPEREHRAEERLGGLALAVVVETHQAGCS